MKSEEFKVLDQKLDHIIEYMDKRFDNVDNRFAMVDKRFDAVDKRFDAYDQKFDQVFTILDNQSKILERLDHERLFTLEHVKRLEHEINRIKVHLKLT